MTKITTLIFALGLVSVLTLTGVGCGQSEESEETQEADAELQALLEEAGIETEEQEWAAHIPGYWTMSVNTPQGSLDVDVAFYDDNSAQGIQGEATIPQGGSKQMQYGLDSIGHWEVNANTIALSGGSVLPFTGTVLSETQMQGMIVDNAGASYQWTADKTGELDRLLSVVGEWMINFTINGQERFEKIACAPNGVCEVMWEKYPGVYEGAPGQERFYKYSHQGGYNFQLESLDGSLSHDLGATWDDSWGGWNADGSYSTNAGDTGSTGGIKISD